MFSDISKIFKPFENNNDDKPVIAYARVSTHKQKNDLENQKQYLHNYCVEKKIKNFEIISDLGSGMIKNIVIIIAKNKLLSMKKIKFKKI